MDQDPDGAFGAAQDARRSRPSTSPRRSAGSAPGGDRRAGARPRPRPRRPRGARRPRLRCRAGRRRRTAASSGAVGMPRPAAPDVGDRRCGRSGRARPGTSRRRRRRPAGRAPRSAAGRQGEQERPLGGVLGVGMAAELVVRVAVHLGEVLPIQGVEGGRVAQGGLDEGSIAVEMDETAVLLRPHLPEHRASHRVTPRPAGGGA